MVNRHKGSGKRRVVVRMHVGGLVWKGERGPRAGWWRVWLYDRKGVGFWLAFPVDGEVFGTFTRVFGAFPCAGNFWTLDSREDGSGLLKVENEGRIGVELTIFAADMVELFMRVGQARPGAGGSALDEFFALADRPGAMVFGDLGDGLGERRFR